MPRRYPTAELYEERQRDFYRDGNRSERSYDELDIELNHSHANPRRSAPDFLREDYIRPPAGPLVVRERREEEVSPRGPVRRREVEQDALVIRSGRGPGPPPPASSVRDVERDDISIRRGVGEGERRRPREVDREETDITIRHREQSRPRGPPTEVSVRERETEREDIIFRRGGGPPRPREVEVDREEVRFRERGPPRREVERDEVTFRHEHREESRHGRERDIEKDSITIRGRERSLPAPRAPRGELVAREREEIIVRRREPTPPPREVVKDQIIIRRRERSLSPPPAPLPPPPPPPPEPEIRPPIIQEIITHHRHIDHGVERARSPTPPPPLPPSPPREEILDIQIRRREGGRGGRDFEEDIIFEREERSSRDSEITQVRGRSLSAPRRRATDLGPPKAKGKDMWTEITRDLVLREAIDSMGYECEETDDFFYVMEYLRYEDVLHLVEISDEIRRKRKSRIQQIEYERESIRERPRSSYDDRYYEHEVTYDRHRYR